MYLDCSYLGVLEETKTIMKTYYKKLKDESNTVLELEEKIEYLARVIGYNEKEFGSIIRKFMYEYLKKDKGDLLLK